MDTEELCARLKPIYGEKIDRLWAAYLTEDRDGRNEIEMVLNVLYARATSEEVGTHHILLRPPPKETAEGAYRLGQVVYNDQPRHSFGIRKKELLQHCAIFGRSGSGKTNTAFLLLSQLLENDTPFLIFDWKRNYRDILPETDEEILIYTLGRDVSPLEFNPLIPPPGTKPTTHLKKLIEIVANAYYLGEGVMFLLQKAIHSVYQDWGVYDGTVTDYPTMQDVLTWLEDYGARGREANWLSSTIRAVGTLCFGEMGRVVNVRRQRPLQELLHRNVILELDALTNSDKTFLVQALLLWIHHLRLAQPERETLKHVILIEEAHHILHKNDSGGESIVDTLLREIRELGEGIILIDQHPSLISRPAMGNTYTTICLNLKHRSDVTTAANCMLLGKEEKQYLGRLKVGQALVRLQDRWPTAFHVKIPWMKLQKGSIRDTEVRSLMRSRSGDSSPDEPPSAERAPDRPSPGTDKDNGALSAEEEQMLLDIVRKPFSGVSKRYDRLSLSRRKGTAVKRSLISRGLVKEEDVSTSSGKIVLLSLTRPGRHQAEELGAETGELNERASMLHEFWRGVVRHFYEDKGYEVTEEKAVSSSGAVDLEARRPGEIVAIEIETGKSTPLANIRKVIEAGYEKILVVGTDKEVTASIRRKAEDAGLLRDGQVQVRPGYEYAL